MAKNLASYNQKKTKGKNGQLWHNERLKSPKYLIDQPNVEVSLKLNDAIALRDKFIEQGKSAYERTKKQKFQSKSYLWSAVVNIKEDTTMDDLKKFADAIHKKHGFNCYQIAIHRDEGHFDKGEKVHNLHAHLEFVTLDLQTGINRQREVRKKELSEIQSLCAEILGMQRGENYYETAKAMQKIGVKYAKPSRIEPRVYAKIKEKEKIELAQGKKLKATYNDLKAYYHSKIKELQQKNAETQLFKAERAKFEKLAQIIKDRNKTPNPMSKDELKAEYIVKAKELQENSKISELNRAQPQTPQNREVSQLSSAVNIAQTKPQTTQSVEIQAEKAAADKEIKGEKQAEQATKSEALADELLAFGKAIMSVFGAQYKTIAEILFPHAYKTHLDLKEVANLAYKAKKAKMPYQITKNLTKGKYALLICDKKENLDSFYKTFKTKSKENNQQYNQKTLQDIEKALRNKGYELAMK